MKWLGLLTRSLSCFLLVFAIWNPEGYSYIDWIWRDDGTRLSIKVAVGLFLFSALLLYMRATWVALGVAGSTALTIVVLLGYLSLRHYGLLDANAPFWTSYMVLVLVGVMFSVGVCWSHVKRRVAGQSQTLSPPP